MAVDNCEASTRRPRVSVIVPVYNTPTEFLNECIESVLAQDFSDYELIIVDDGSDAATASVLDSISRHDNRIRLLRQPNRGVSAARNLALDEARGEYVTFVDSDDALLPGALTRLIDQLASTGGAIATAGVTMKPGVMTGDGHYETLSGREAVEKVFRQHNYAWNNGVGGKLFERRLFDNVRFSLNRYEDLELIPTLYMAVQAITYDPQAVYFYRQHGASFSGTLTPSRFDVLDVMDRLRERMGGLNRAIDRALDDRTFSAACNIVSLIARGDRDGRFSDIADRASDIIKRYRRQILFDRKARLKNRLGALTALIGRRFFTAVARCTRV